MVSQPNTAFLICGRDNKSNDAITELMFSWGVSTMTWTRAKVLARTTLGRTPTIFEIVQAGMRESQCIIALFTPDMNGTLRREFVRDAREGAGLRQPRANVLFEAGVALGLYPDKTILVDMGSVEIGSDFDGLHRMRLGNDSMLSLREELAVHVAVNGSVGSLPMDWQTSEVVLRRQLWVNSRWSYKELLTKEDLSHVGQPVPCPLAPDEKAYALVSAIQHGDRSVPYWIQQGHAEQKVVAELVDVVIHGPHRRPSLRAARALEAVDMHVLNETTARLADGNPVMDDWRIELVTAAAGTGEVERLLREGGTDKWRLRADELEATIAELATYPRRGPPRLSQNV